MVVAVIRSLFSPLTPAASDATALMCVLQSVSGGATRFGSDDALVCFQLKLIKLSL